MGKADPDPHAGYRSADVDWLKPKPAVYQALYGQPLPVADDAQLVEMFKSLRLKGYLEHMHGADVPDLIRAFDCTHKYSFHRQVHVIKSLYKQYGRTSARMFAALKANLEKVAARQARTLRDRLKAATPTPLDPTRPVIDGTEYLRNVPGYPTTFVDMRDGQLYTVKRIERQPHAKAGNKPRWRVVVKNAAGKPTALLCARAVYAAKTGQMPTREIDHIDGDPFNDCPHNLRDVDRETNEENKKHE